MGNSQASKGGEEGWRENLYNGNQKIPKYVQADKFFAQRRIIGWITFAAILVGIVLLTMLIYFLLVAIPLIPTPGPSSGSATVPVPSHINQLAASSVPPGKRPPSAAVLTDPKLMEYFLKKGGGCGCGG